MFYYKWLTFCISFSISVALITKGPRTAYSIFLTHGFIFSNVIVGAHFSTWVDILLRISCFSKPKWCCLFESDRITDTEDGVISMWFACALDWEVDIVDRRQALVVAAQEIEVYLVLQWPNPRRLAAVIALLIRIVDVAISLVNERPCIFQYFAGIYSHCIIERSQCTTRALL